VECRTETAEQPAPDLAAVECETHLTRHSIQSQMAAITRKE
jgi:hypothetical protein